jgi:hypothetical protein
VEENTSRTKGIDAPMVTIFVNNKHTYAAPES